MRQVSPRLHCLVSLAFFVAACKESMHPPQATEDTEQSTVAANQTAPRAAESVSKPSEPPKKEVTSDGYELIRAKTRDGENADVAVKAPPGWKVVQPPDTPDPHGGKFSLTEALKGLPGKGQLTASIRTSMGTFQCDLYDDKTPITVANFVGLARGLRKFWSGKDQAWVGRPYYDGTTFHRVIPGFMIQGGDWSGDGSGAMFYNIPDELNPTLKHDRGGQLCMANRGPNTNGAQFFITEDAAPHLDSSYTIFGQCNPVQLVNRIARVPQSGPPNNRPLTPVYIEHVSIQRQGAVAQAPHEALAMPAKTIAPAAVPAARSVQVAAPQATQPTAP
jgi:peptidyl-prolyl cis-trans isomerase A (cyclophilin A)